MREVNDTTEQVLYIGREIALKYNCKSLRIDIVLQNATLNYELNRF